MKDQILDLLALPGVRAGAVAIGAILAAYLVQWIFSRTVIAFTRHTKTDLDDQIVDALRRPVFLSVILIGLAVASLQLEMPAQGRYVLYGGLKTLGILTFAAAVMRIASIVLQALSAREGNNIIQHRTRPIFDIFVKLLIMGGAVYFLFLAWEIDVTAWLASAGIIGIAVGFAAQDTLSNLFAGVFIVADAPYQLGDFIVLEGGIRGQVTRIGMRSTRILTLDHVEITVPNSVISKSQIVNEAGGPQVRQRCKVRVGVAYGSDVERVTEVLLACAEAVTGVVRRPTPEVWFSDFGESSLDFDLLVWVDDPAQRDRILSEIRVHIYKALAVAGIEIPFPKRDLYIKEMPAALRDKPGK